MARNIRLTLAYDGTAYCGWQVQSNGPTVQAALERAILAVTGEHCSVFSAGRTDSGVHALGQVANFHTSSPLPAANFRPALQTKLPPDIVVLDARDALPEFHATFDAKRKQYRYLIDNSGIALPFLRRYAWQLRRPLDADAMHSAAQSLVGRHDFRSFETDWPNKASSVRTVMSLCVKRRPLWEMWDGAEASDRDQDETAARPLIVIEITADGFLYNMVRSITGTLVNVGRKKWSSCDVERILRAQQREAAGATAPACGLYLVRVDY